MKKVRIQSPLEKLPLHVKQQLAAWLTTGGCDGVGMTYKEAKTRLFAEYGVRAGISALHLFFKRHTRASASLPDSPAVAVVRSPEDSTFTLVINIHVQSRIPARNESKPDTPDASDRKPPAAQA